MSKQSSKPFQLPMTLILAIFTCTFFIYRDFGLRMIVGYAILGSCTALHLGGLVGRREKPQLSSIDWAALALAGAVLVQYLRPDARRDEDTYAYAISMVICMALLVTTWAKGQHLRRSEQVFYGGAVFMAAFVLVFTLLPEVFLSAVYPRLSGVAQRYYDYFGPRGYGVSLGGYTYCDYVLFLGIAVCCGQLASKEWSLKRAGFCGGSLLVFLASITVLGRRGELLGALVTLAVLVLALCSPKQRKTLVLLGVAVCAAGVVLVLLFLPQLKAIPVLYRYVETVENLLAGRDASSGRGALMAIALKGFLSAPIFGVGWGNYGQLAAPLGFIDTEGKLFTDCHNIYLQFLCETGAVGAVLILLPLGYIFFITVRRLMSARAAGDRTALGYSVISFSIQFFLLFLGLYDPTFQKIVFWCFYGLALLFLKAAEGGEA